MTIAELLREAKAKLQGGQEDVLGVEVLLAFVLGKDRAWLVAHDDAQVSEEQGKRFGDLFLRLHAGEPVAYLTGKKEFYGLDFLVNKNVLIPRPETELLVEKVLEFARRTSQREGAGAGQGGAGLKVLDIGTGSGCIAVSVAKHLPDAQVTAVDVSGEALQIAKKNAELHEALPRMSFAESDLMAGVEGAFDVVVANLPYIGTERYKFVSREAREYEPHVALFGGGDGLRLYAKLFEQVTAASWKPRLLLGEFGFLQGDEMRELLNKFFTHAEWEVEKDLAGIERIFMVRFGGKF